MSLSFTISPASDVPIFRQIVQQIHRAVATGKLHVGDQLPAVRALAETLVINPNTVARSYQELIREGIVESQSGRGVFVAERREIYSEAEQMRRLTFAAEQLCHEAMLLAATLPEVRALVEATWKNLQDKTSDRKRPNKGRTP